MDTRSEPLEVSVYVRPAQLIEPIDAKIETVHRLESSGILDAVSVHAWPEKVTLSEQTPYTSVVEAFREMESWADEHDVSIQPPFDVRTTTSSFTGTTRTVLRTPVMSLSVYADEQLASVFPHSRGGEQYSVTDAIAALRTDDIELFSADPKPSRQLPDRCSNCASLLTNVQGIGVCQECDRIEFGPPAGRSRDRFRHSPSP